MAITVVCTFGEPQRIRIRGNIRQGRCSSLQFVLVREEIVARRIDR